MRQQEFLVGAFLFYTTSVTANSKFITASERNVNFSM